MTSEVAEAASMPTEVSVERHRASTCIDRQTAGRIQFAVDRASESQFGADKHDIVFENDIAFKGDARSAVDRGRQDRRFNRTLNFEATGQ